MQIVYEAQLLDQAPKGLSYEQETEWLKQWANNHNFMCYAAPRNVYNEATAMNVAKAGGFKGILADCLS